MFHNLRWNTAKLIKTTKKKRKSSNILKSKQRGYCNGQKLKSSNNRQEDNNYNHKLKQLRDKLSTTTKDSIEEKLKSCKEEPTNMLTIWFQCSMLVLLWPA